MPAAPKTSDAKIVAAARRLIAKEGHGVISMHDVAGAVGIRAPSLHGRFPTKVALLAAVEVDLWADLARVLAVAAPRTSRDPVAALTSIGRAYRKFAKANPGCYALMSDAWATRGDAGQQARAATFAVALPHLIALAGGSRALEAGRVLTPFLHGFVSMELAGSFRMGGSIDVAFAFGLRTILEGLRGLRGVRGLRGATHPPGSGRARSRR